MLLAAGARPNDADELGNRALHMVCCTRGHGLDVTLGRDKYGTMTTSVCPSQPGHLHFFVITREPMPSTDLAINLWRAAPRC